MKESLFYFLLFLMFCVNAFSTDWKGILLSGDSSVNNFDNSRRSLGRILEQIGIDQNHQTHLSTSKELISSSVKKAGISELKKSFSSFDLNHNSGCFLFLSGHGDTQNGFVIEGSGDLSSYALGAMLDDTCAARPTIVLISACYSGQFIDHNLKAPNRVILTSSYSDRPSFGCSAGSSLPYWDKCLLSTLETTKTDLGSINWLNVYEEINLCVEKREAKEKVDRSFPEIFIGKDWLECSI